MLLGMNRSAFSENVRVWESEAVGEGVFRCFHPTNPDDRFDRENFDTCPTLLMIETLLERGWRHSSDKVVVLGAGDKVVCIRGDEARFYSSTSGWSCA